MERPIKSYTNDKSHETNKDGELKRLDDRSTEQEYDKNREIRENILSLLKQGYYRTQVAEELGISVPTVYSNVKVLVNEGRIKEEEIKKEKPGTKKGKRHKNKSEEEILNLLKQGYSGAEIIRKLGISQPLVYRYIRILIDAGRIKEEEVKKRKRRCKKRCER